MDRCKDFFMGCNFMLWNETACVKIEKKRIDNPGIDVSFFITFTQLIFPG